MEPSIAPDSHLQLRYEKYKGILKEFTLMSDIFMRNVFKKRKCTEHVLRIIMNRMELKVIDQIIQKDYKNLQGRSAILDCVARDSEGRQFDVGENGVVTSEQSVKSLHFIMKITMAILSRSSIHRG